jgi:hypothetical protein
LAAGRAADAQARGGTVTVTPGEQYEAGAFTRALLGSGWRDLWATPVNAAILDLSTYAGGLTFDKRGGGLQTLTVHVTEEEGWREYRFRSVDKFIAQGMPPTLKGTALGSLLEDQVSILLPAAPLLVPPLLEAIGALHVTPELYVMGDNRRLGTLRDTVAGMLGTFELKGSEAPDKKPGFAGSRAIKGTEKFLEDIASSRAHRLDERDFLAVRLIDFLINDSDRTADNFDWARFGDDGAYTWRALPRDRDWAFMDARGVWNKLVARRMYPKLVPFTEEFPLKGLTHRTHPLDRRLLQRLTADDVREVSLRVQRAVTDSVIAQVVAQLPREWRTQTSVAERITTVLRARRDGLPDVAMAFYRNLSSDVDVHGTEEADRIDVVRHADGRVTVTVTDPERRAVVASERRDDGLFVTTSEGSVERAPFFQRTFHPSETKEVRVYANGGDDAALVRGAASGSIVVRVIGGKGDDVLADSAGGGDTYFYDAEGKDRFDVADGTHVDERAWKQITPGFGFRISDPWKPDWGKKSGWRPVVGFNTGAGVIVGVGPQFRQYGFRRLPYHWDANVNFLVGTGNGRVGVTADLDHRAENSPRSVRVTARASQLETVRFFGYGNNTADAGRAESLVDQSIVGVEPSLVWDLGWRKREGGDPLDEDSVSARLRPMVGEFRVGSVLNWVHPEPGPTSRLTASGARGASDFALAGGTLALELNRTDDDAVPTTGWKLDADLAAYPALGSSKAFGTASAGGRFYVPLLGAGKGPHLAVRAGGDLATGDYPVQYSAAIGGKRSLRGYQFRRFAGDAGVHAGTELRVPVGTINLLVRSQLGVFGLADAGRVWFDGGSEGGWHSAVGGGFWLSAFGRSVSVAYARGDANRLYFKTGLSY